MSLTIIVGGHGSEPKGKIAAYLALADQVALAARAAGATPHTIEWNGQPRTATWLSCAFVQPDTRLLVGPGININVGSLLDEIERLDVTDRVGIDRLCLVQDGRKRAADIAALQPFLTDVPLEFNAAVRGGRPAVIEANGGLSLSPLSGAGDDAARRDITAQQACVDAGVGPTLVTDVYLVLTALTPGAGDTETPIGGDPVPADFDMAGARAAIIANGATGIVLSNLEMRLPRAQAAQRRSHLPNEARDFIDRVQALLELPVVLASTGPLVDHIVDLR